MRGAFFHRRRLAGRGPSEEGVALLLVIGYLAAMTIFLTAFLGALTHTLDREGIAEKRLIALNIAEGGLHKALAALQTRPNAYRGEEATALGEGQFTVEVHEGHLSGTYEVVSTGELGHSSLVVHRVRIGALLGFDKGSLRILRWNELPGQAAFKEGS